MTTSLQFLTPEASPDFFKTQFPSIEKVIADWENRALKIKTETLVLMILNPESKRTLAQLPCNSSNDDTLTEKGEAQSVDAVKTFERLTEGKSRVSEVVSSKHTPTKRAADVICTALKIDRHITLDIFDERCYASDTFRVLPVFEIRLLQSLPYYERMQAVYMMGMECLFQTVSRYEFGLMQIHHAFPGKLVIVIGQSCAMRALILRHLYHRGFDLDISKIAVSSTEPIVFGVCPKAGVALLSANSVSFI